MNIETLKNLPTSWLALIPTHCACEILPLVDAGHELLLVWGDNTRRGSPVAIYERNGQVVRIVRWGRITRAFA